MPPPRRRARSSSRASGRWTASPTRLATVPRGPTALARIATDTRTVAAGDCFVALRGEKFDAHEFLADAVAKGAAAVVVHDATRGAKLGVPVFVVDDTTRALGRLARYRRRVWGRPVIGVAGTNGKTSTKELLRAALGSVLRVHATRRQLQQPRRRPADAVRAAG